MRLVISTFLIFVMAGLVFAQPIPPKDAEWTLYCQTIPGADHVRMAKVQKEMAIKATGMPDFYIIHGEGDSKLYYGYYRAIEPKVDKKEAERAQTDRKRLERFMDAAGKRPFGLSMFVEIATPDPDGPPQWNLANSGGYFSLQIAAYKDSPLRKQYAVDAVREARKQGINAYYFHGETTSSVCIGAWPRSAVKEQESSDGRSSNSDEPILVSNTPLSAEQIEQLKKQNPIAPTKTFAPKFEPTDPTLIKAMHDYPTHAVNGDVYMRKGVPDTSFIIIVPEKPQSILSGTGPAAPVNENQPDPSLAKPAVPSGTGKLKSLE